MIFDVVVCVTKASSICVAPGKIFVYYLFCHLSIATTGQSVHCKCLTT